MFKLNKKAIILIVVVLIISGVIIIAHQFFKGKIEKPVTNFPSVLTAPQIQKEIVKDLIKNQTPKSVEKIPPYSGRSINEIKIGQGFNSTPGVVAKKKKDLDVLADALAKDPLNINDWVAVGVIKKFFNDYEGARDAWEYVTIVYPSDPLAFENLGNLYALYLKNPSRAEYNLKKAIGLNPYEASFYLSLADFYKNIAKNPSKVSEIILSGMSVIKDVNLTLYLASYYRDIGDKTNALKYYEQVLKESPNQQGIQEEIDRLSR